MKIQFLLSAACVLLSTAVGGEVRFLAGPSAAKSNGDVKITFTVSGKTDVEVAVLDAKGNVVRHLAAGMLGAEKAPPPPLAKGFAQSLEWNGRDDFGKPAGGGPFKVRVRCGLGFKFGRLIGGDPYTFGGITALAADEDGNVYVQGYGGLLNQKHMTIRVFDPEGRYLREIAPFPANVEPGDMKEVARWDEARKTFRPRQLKNLNPEFYGGGRGSCLKLVSASKKNGVLLTDSTRIFKLKANGAVLDAKFMVRKLWSKKDTPWGGIPNSGKGPVCIAVSHDGRYVYESGPFTAKTRYGHKMNPRFPPGRVFRVDLGDPKAVMGEFVTVKVAHEGGVGGNWTKGLGYGFGPRGPVQGIAVDKKGLVYVCDREHERISVYDPSGKLVNEVPVKYANQVAVHPETGAVYVMQRDRKSYSEWFAQLVKFDKLGKDRRPGATMKFDRKASYPQMALSAGEKGTVVWVSGVQGGLVALKDAGGSFQRMETHFKPRRGAQRDWNRLAVDYARDEVYVNNGSSDMWRYDGKTGEGERLKVGGKFFYATDLAVGYDGLLYVRGGHGRPPGQDYSGPFLRLTRDLKPAPFGGSGSHVMSSYIYSRYGIGYAERGIGVGPDGKSYVSFMYRWVAYAIGGFGPGGKPLPGNYLKGKFPGKTKKKGAYPEGWDTAIIGPVPQANAGIRVDWKGNIYAGFLYWPKGLNPPHGYKMDRMWTDTVGCVLKFDPQKGGAMEGKDGQQRAASVSGALNTYPGMAPFSKAGIGGNTCCVCRGPRFDIDRFGRLALPNAVTCSVLIYDNAGNLIAEVGRYGNFDSQYVPPESAGKKPLVGVPEIPLTWATGAGWSAKHLYVNDTYSRRAVRADLTWALEATCPAAGGSASVKRSSARTAALKPSDDSDTSDLSDRSERSDKSEHSKPRAVRGPQSALRSPERVCTGWFSAARNYRRVGMKKDARRCLNNIIKDYPNTQWATKARQELSRL
jgi:DNA-binding beta-propeller fold protein YncE